MENKLNGYICFYKGKRYEIYSFSKFNAQTQMSKQLGIKKAWEIDVILAELDSKPVIHIAVD